MKNLKKNRHSLRSLLPEGVKATNDTRLTMAAITLEYAFTHNVNFKERTILLSGSIGEATFNLVDAAITEMESHSRKTITVKINSQGGEVYHALAIVGRLTKSPCYIITEGYGQVMSAATMILAAGDKRRLSRFSFFMHHEPSYAVEGRHSEIRANVHQAEREEEQWCEWMEEFTSKKRDFWKKNGVGIDVYFTAEQLMEFGVIDEIF